MFVIGIVVLVDGLAFVGNGALIRQSEFFDARATEVAWGIWTG
jgi:hypothetical protein